MQSEELKSVTHFKYLDTSIDEGCGMKTEITNRVGACWRNCKKCCGVLCDRRMSEKLKGEIYKTVIASAMLGGAEMWATTKRRETRIEVNEMGILYGGCAE